MTTLYYSDDVLKRVSVSRQYVSREEAEADADSFKAHAMKIAGKHGVSNWEARLYVTPDMSDRWACAATYNFQLPSGTRFHRQDLVKAE